MAKDPAFLFYSNDFDAATKFFTDEQVGIYLRLMIAQHQHGHLNEKQVKHICRTHDEEVLSKFQKDENGLFFSERLDFEINRRKKFSESRSNNRKGHDTSEEDMNNISKTHENHMSPHMETETEIEIEKGIKTEKTKKQKPFPDCLDDIKPEKPKQEPVTLENPFGKEFHQTHWQNWKIYRTQTLKKPVKPGSESAALKELWDDSGGDPVTAAKMIQKSIANGYQGLFPVNGKANGKPQTANQQIHDLANNGVFLKPPPDKFVEVIQADGQRFTGNLELDNGLIVFVKAGRNRVTIDPQNDFHASCTYKLAPGRTIQEVYEYLINEQMELV